MQDPTGDTSKQPQPRAETSVRSKDDERHVKLLIENFKVELSKILSKYRSPRDFDPIPTDVFIVSWMKSGTTLMQNLTYQLTVSLGKVKTDVNGDKFRDISAVVPFIEMSPVCGVYKSIHSYSPSLWKSHAPIDEFMHHANYRQNCKFLYCVRNGLSVARSFLDFIYGWIIKNDRAGIEQSLYEYYFEHFFLHESHWFEHVKQWLVHSGGIYPSSPPSGEKQQLSNVYVIVYEDFCKDVKQGTIDVGKFLGEDILAKHTAEQQKVLDFVLKKCDQDAMANDSRFQDLMVSEGMGWDVAGGKRVLPKGEVGFKKYRLPERLIDMYNKKFEQTFTYENYDQLCNVIRQRNYLLRKEQGW